MAGKENNPYAIQKPLSILNGSTHTNKAWQCRASACCGKKVPLLSYKSIFQSLTDFDKLRPSSEILSAATMGNMYCQENAFDDQSNDGSLNPKMLARNLTKQPFLFRNLSPKSL